MTKGAPRQPADPGRRAGYRKAQDAYQAVKAHWLEAGARDDVRVTVMDARLRAARALRRALEQATKAARRLDEAP